MKWIARNPKVARMVGHALFSLGGLVIISGLIARAGMTALNQTRALGKLPPYGGLSEAYPMYALWWVPEHLLGYILPAVVVSLGVYVALTAKALIKASGKRTRNR